MNSILAPLKTFLSKHEQWLLALLFAALLTTMLVNVMAYGGVVAPLAVVIRLATLVFLYLTLLATALSFWPAAFRKIKRSCAGGAQLTFIGWLIAGLALFYATLILVLLPLLGVGLVIGGKGLAVLLVLNYSVPLGVFTACLVLAHKCAGFLLRKGWILGIDKEGGGIEMSYVLALLLTLVLMEPVLRLVFA